jgi:FkbM family methyltransferase
VLSKEAELEATLRQWRSREIHDADFSAFSLLSRRVSCILDVGANRGQSIASFRRTYQSAEIHSFEANPLLIEVLQSVVDHIPGPNILHPYGLGAADANVPLFVPFVGGQFYLEEATTRLDYFDQPWVAEKFRQRGGLQIERVYAKLRVGDSLQLKPDVIKIDVEGAEHQVLLGLEQTIRSCVPIMLIENSDYHNVTSFLSGIGYRPFRYEQIEHRLVDFHGETTNAIYLHGDAR